MKNAWFIWLVAISVLPCGLSKSLEAAAPEGWQRVEQTARHMGTLFRFVIYTDAPQSVSSALQAANRRIAELDAVLSDYQSGSELSRLTTGAPHAMPIAVSDDLFRVLRLSQDVSQASQGAFDVTVGPVSRIWRRARRTGRMPDPTALEAAGQRVGFDQLRLFGSPPAAQCLQAGMRLDAGGIAKGDALDQALLVLQRAGMTRVLIDGGGDIRVGDPPPGETAWLVAIADLSGKPSETATLRLANQAVATSGDVWQAFEQNGIRYSHLIDPRTSRPITRRSSATVIASDAVHADAWASALSVLGPEAVAHVARQTQAARLLYFDNDSQSVRNVTANWDAFGATP